MSTNSSQYLRVSDAERQAVADRLGEHFAEGRLDQDEFGERAGRAMTAKTRADLSGLFDDLPDLSTRPQTGTAPVPVRPAGIATRFSSWCSWSSSPWPPRTSWSRPPCRGYGSASPPRSWYSPPGAPGGHAGTAANGRSRGASPDAAGPIACTTARDRPANGTHRDPRTRASRQAYPSHAAILHLLWPGHQAEPESRETGSALLRCDCSPAGSGRGRNGGTRDHGAGRRWNDRPGQRRAGRRRNRGAGRKSRTRRRRNHRSGQCGGWRQRYQ